MNLVGLIYITTAIVFFIGAIISNLYFSNHFMRMPHNITIVQGKLGNSDDPIGQVVPYMQLRNSWDMVDEG